MLLARLPAGSAQRRAMIALPAAPAVGTIQAAEFDWFAVRLTVPRRCPGEMLPGALLAIDPGRALRSSSGEQVTSTKSSIMVIKTLL